jgi:hypothetical protein
VDGVPGGMERGADEVSGDCRECGGALLWGGMSWVEHAEEWHQARRRVLMRRVGRVLAEELVMRRMAQDAAVGYGCVLVVWQVGGGGEGGGRFWSQIPFAVWDAPSAGGVDGTALAQIGRGLRDAGQERYGVRPHWAQTRVRVFDERVKNLA